MSDADTAIPRDILVQWTSEEADTFTEDPSPATGSRGWRMRHVREGDRLFVCTTSEDEVYLLGALLVHQVTRRKGKSQADGESLCDEFKRRPLGKLKWELRFQSGGSPRLKRTKSLTWQLRPHR